MYKPSLEQQGRELYKWQKENLTMMNTYGESVKAHGPVCSLCQQRIALDFENKGSEPNICKHCDFGGWTCAQSKMT